MYMPDRRSILSTVAFGSAMKNATSLRNLRYLPTSTPMPVESMNERADRSIITRCPGLLSMCSSSADRTSLAVLSSSSPMSATLSVPPLFSNNVFISLPRFYFASIVTYAPCRITPHKRE